MRTQPRGGRPVRHAQSACGGALVRCGPGEPAVDPGSHDRRDRPSRRPPRPSPRLPRQWRDPVGVVGHVGPLAGRSRRFRQSRRYVASMPVFALWSAPRARSTAFFRSMLERGDLLALHEPLEGLIYFGSSEVEGRTFESATSLLAWLRDETDDINVFLKETTDHRV